MKKLMNFPATGFVCALVFLCLTGAAYNVFSPGGDLSGTWNSQQIVTGAVTDTKASLAVKPPSTVVATANQTLSGTPTLDGVATADGSIILNTAQSTGAENGPWVAHAGAWTRPTWYPNGGTTQAFQFITTLIRLGTTYQGTTWRMTTAGAITIGTTTTTWTVTPLALNSNTVTGTVPLTSSNFATPSATVGLTANAGSATTGTRSDGTPALDITIVPTWTGIHTWSLAEPRLLFNETDVGSDLKLWDFDLNASVFCLRTRTDANGAGTNAWCATRGTTTAISNISIGNGSSTYTFGGSGTSTFTGAVSASKIIPSGSTVGTAPGLILPGSNRLGFVSGSSAALMGEFNSNGTFATYKNRSDQGYSAQVPTTGFSITATQTQSTLILKPAGTLATGTITMAASPMDGQEFRATSTQIITALTVSANAGQSIIAAPTTLSPGLGFGYIYVLADTTWYRLY